MREKQPDVELVVVPRQGVYDDQATLVIWEVEDRQHVKQGDIVAQMETTKSVFEVQCPCDGYLVHIATKGTRLDVGSTIAYVVESPESVAGLQRPPLPPVVRPDRESQIVSRKAREIIDRENVPLSVFADLPVVREEDVRKVLTARSPQRKNTREFRGQALDQQLDWDTVLQDPLLQQMKELLTKLRMRMRAKYNRHVSTNDHLYDRWELARDYGFGEGTSVYDSATILGDVSAGRNCWIGPQTILDGSGGLTIGDHVDVGAGAHIYSHNTIQRALTGHLANVFYNPTTIGNCCFIAPHAVISAGTSLGDHSFVAAGSYVEGRFSANSFLEGNPARKTGHIVIEGSTAKVVRSATLAEPEK